MRPAAAEPEFVGLVVARPVAATFVANPDNREDATAVSTAVATFCHELVTAIKAMGQKTPAAVAGVLASTSYPLPSALRAKLEPAHKALYKRREELLAAITKALRALQQSLQTGLALALDRSISSSGIAGPQSNGQ